MARRSNGSRNRDVMGKGRVSEESCRGASVPDLGPDPGMACGCTSGSAACRTGGTIDLAGAWRDGARGSAPLARLVAGQLRPHACDQHRPAAHASAARSRHILGYSHYRLNVLCFQVSSTPTRSARPSPRRIARRARESERRNGNPLGRCARAPRTRPCRQARDPISLQL